MTTFKSANGKSLTLEAPDAAHLVMLQNQRKYLDLIREDLGDADADSMTQALIDQLCENIGRCKEVLSPVLSPIELHTTWSPT